MKFRSLRNVEFRLLSNINSVLQGSRFHHRGCFFNSLKMVVIELRKGRLKMHLLYTYVGKCIVYLQDKGTLLRPIVEGNLFTSIETLPISLSARRGSAPTLTMRETEIQLWSAHPRYYCRNLKKSRRRTFGRKKLQSLRRRPTG